MHNATGGKDYDFKVRGVKDMPVGTTISQYSYRGMPFEGIANFGNQDGATTTFASARDIGNVAAGYVSATNGLPWTTARLGFDYLESNQQGKPAVEGKPTQMAQKVGWNAGADKYKRGFLKGIHLSEKPFPVH
jgi:hypothetical protein